MGPAIPIIAIASTGAGAATITAAVRFYKQYKQQREQLESNSEELTILKTQLQVQKLQNEKNLIEITERYNMLLEKSKILTNPSTIKEVQQKIFCEFLDSLKSYRLYSHIPKQGDVKYVVIIGETSAGKSTIFNNTFGLQLKTGHAEVTQTIEIVKKDEKNKRIYWDCPGLNQEIEIVNPQILKAFYDMDQVFIVTGTTFKFCKQAIQVMNKIDPPALYLVRTQCDRFQSEEEFEKAVAQDIQTLAAWNVDREILYISSLRPDEFKDNARFKNLLTGSTTK